MASTKQIPIDQVKLGMFVVGMDQPWYRTPFLFHKRLISDPNDIVQMKRHGIKEVTIDTERGTDVGQDPAPTQEAAPETPSEAPPDEKSPGPSNREDSPAQHVAAAKAAYREATAAMERVFSDLEAGTSPKLVTLKNIVGGLLNRILTHPDSMMIQLCLEQMRRFDRTLASHGMEVCILALIVAVENGCVETDRETLGVGALLHDVGYIRLPRNLYRKSSRLTEQEKSLMHQHPQLAATVLAQGDQFPESVSKIIAQHHEHADGSGYPNALKNDALSSLSQIVGLVDTYGGMITPRHGRPALLPHDAIRQLFILGEKGRFDKALVEVAIKALGVYPIGSLIKLNTNEYAVVVGLNREHRLKPRIRIIKSPEGTLYNAPLEIDLTDTDSTGPTRSIQRALDPNQEHIDVAAYVETKGQ
ncbi:MAG: DUF3391 domain-containing protein [Nitrospira sp.]|nr:MAG: DUF3391 domain-containing protein [Nitrospira sp.]